MLGRNDQGYAPRRGRLHHVHNARRDKQHDERIHRQFGFLIEDGCQRNDDPVKGKENLPNRHAKPPAHNHANDIEPAGRAPGANNHPISDAGQHTTENGDQQQVAREDRRSDIVKQDREASEEVVLSSDEQALSIDCPVLAL